MKIINEIFECRKAMQNKSPKPLARLKASLAALRHQQLLAMLPGSARRGLERGNIKPL